MTFYNASGMEVISQTGGGGAADGGNFIAAGTRTALSNGTVLFSNANGVTFGLNTTNGTVMTASVAAGGGGMGISAGTQSVSTGTMIFANSNGMTFGMSGSSQITGSYTVPSTAGLLSAVNLSAGTTSQNLSAMVFSNSNGISFGLDGSTVTGSHNGLTTARASNDAVGLNTAQTNVTWTVNSAGISLNAAGYAGTTTAITGRAAITMNSAGFQFNGSGIAGTGFTSTTTAGTAIVATNSTNGLSLAFPTIITNALTTARASTDAVGLNTAQTNVTWTVNSAGISFNAGGYAGTGTSATNASITMNSNGLAISVAAPGGGAAVTVSDAASSGTIGRLAFTNLNGVTLSLSTGAGGSHTIVGSHNALTSQSNQAFSADASSTFQTLTSRTRTVSASATTQAHCALPTLWRGLPPRSLVVR